MSAKQAYASLSLAIDATPAKQGAAQFTAAIAAIRKAVAGLEKDTEGVFVALKNLKPQFDVTPITRASTEANTLSKALASAGTASEKVGTHTQRAALAASMALRQATTSAQKLGFRLGDLGQTAALDQLDAGLDRLHAQLRRAPDVAAIRVARNEYENLRTELTQGATAAEYARGSLAQLAREQADAARSAAQHAAQLESLALKYNPLRASSLAYAQSLDEIMRAEQAGVITSQLAAQAREHAAQRLAIGSAANDQFTVSAGQARSAAQQMGYQVNDVLTMASMGASPLQVVSSQIFQISQAMELAGGKAQAFGNVKTALLGLLTPTTLVVGAVIGITTALVQFGIEALWASDDTKSFADALSDATSQISTLQSATATLAGARLGSLADGYGRVNVELQRHLEKLQQIAQIEATVATRDAFAGLGNDYLGGWLTTDVDDLRIAFGTTNDKARDLLALLNEIKSAQTFDQQFDAVQRMRAEVESVSGGIRNAEGGAQAFLMQLLRAEDAGLRLKAAQDGTTVATDNASGAAHGLTYSIGTAADEAARLLSLLNGVPGALSVMGKSVEGQISGIRAQNRALSLELSEGLSSAAANRRVQLETMVSTAGARGQKISPDAVANEWQKISELDAAAKETERLRKQISEANRPAKSAKGGKGGSRTAELTEEQKAVESLNDTLTERLTSLQEERIALGLVASGTFQTTEAAELFAKAMLQGGGSVDAQTSAMIRQIDAAARLNEELTKAAKDPLREWMNGVPDWLEAGKQIEVGAITSLRDAISEMMRTGKFDVENLGEAVLGTISEIVADKATKELLALLGRGEQSATGGFAGMLAGLFSSEGDSDAAAMVTGSASAGQAISSAMTTAGAQVAAQIQAAMTGAGAQAGVSVQSGIAAGSNSVRQAAQSGLAVGSNSIRAAAASGGPVLGQGVVAGSQQGAMMLAQGVAAGASGGGILSGLGGWQGIASMALGVFHEGGISHSPSTTRNMAVTPSMIDAAPRFHNGGLTSGEHLAVLRDSEAVIPLRGGKVPVELGGAAGGKTTVQTINMNVNGVTDFDSFKRSRGQIEADLARAGQRSLQKNG